MPARLARAASLAGRTTRASRVEHARYHTRRRTCSGARLGDRRIAEPSIGSTWSSMRTPAALVALLALALLALALLALAPSATWAQVAPQPIVLITEHALDGRGGVLRDARIGITDGRITTLNADA